MASDPVRSREGRRLAERALLWLLFELRESAVQPVVLGGLVPDLLTPGPPASPAHLGTTDVDLLVSVELDDLNALEEVERALDAAGFQPDLTTRGGWRWRVEVEGVPVKVEFLCDRSDRPAESAISAGGRLGVNNLRGTGYVARDYQVRTLRGALRDGREVEVRSRFAGLSGYLLAKCTALRERDLVRDAYDIVYVLLYNHAGGPRHAARALRSSPLADELPRMGRLFAELRARFAGPQQFGPQSFATEMRRVTPDADPAVLAQDAVAAMSEFLDELA